MVLHKRYRLVHRQNGREHVSSVILTMEEAIEQMHAEQIIHEDTGWLVVRDKTDLQTLLICSKGDTVRTVGIKESEALSDKIDGSSNEELHSV